MLDYIKSKLIFKKIFSFLREKIILKVANYNKSLQNKLGKSLIFYKVMSRKYILYEGKNKGKLYDADSNKLLYIGEFINAKKNGKGKEYNDNGQLSYEGEYLNGERNGYGKEFYYDGQLKFEGEYINNKKINGREYSSGNIVFKGQFFNNKQYNGEGYDKNGNIIYEIINGNGKGKEYNDYGNLIFEGEYLDGERNGNGKEYNENGILIFEGDYLNGKRKEKKNKKNIIK